MGRKASLDCVEFAIIGGHDLIALLVRVPGHQVAFGFSGHGVTDFFHHGENHFVLPVVVEITDIVIADVARKLAGAPDGAQPDIVPGQALETAFAVGSRARHDAPRNILRS
jgi:hypothetical protein